MSRIRMQWVAAAVMAAVAVTGCQGGDPDRDGPNTETDESVGVPEQLVVSQPRDTGVISALPISKFHRTGAALRASHVLHDVVVDGGRARITPFHFEQGQRTAGRALSLETVKISRGSVLLGAGAESMTLGEHGTADMLRGEVVESLVNREDGIEQLWSFEERPLGTGELNVEVAVEGHAFVSTTSSGLHFATADQLGFRYSHAIWRDSTGAEWDIEARFVDGRIRISVPPDVLDATSFPAVLDPTVTPETAVDVPVIGHSGAHARSSAIAFDGTNYLVVWSDTRLERDDDIFATRVSASGQVLDATGIQVHAAAGRQVHPTVTFTGGRFVVAWEDYKVAGGAEADIVAATVTSQGVVSQLGAVAFTATNETQPQLASNGTTALLVWNANGNVRGAVLTSAFGSAFDIAATAASEIEPTASGNPSGDYLVAWSEGPSNNADIRGRFVSPAGALPGGTFAISAAQGLQYRPRATFDGSNHMVVWTNNHAGINLYGSRVTPGGVVLDTRTEGMSSVGGVAVSTAANNQELQEIACSSAGCLVVWQERRNINTSGYDIYAQRLSSAFSLVGTELVLSNLNGSQLAPAVGSDGTGFLASWTDFRDNVNEIVFATRVSGAGAVLDGSGTNVVSGYNRQVASSVGRAGPIFGVFWTDSRTVGGGISFVRYNSNGSALDATARTATTGALAEFNPSATFGGTTFLVVWSDTRTGTNKDIYATRVDQNGTVIDPAGIAVTLAAADQLVPKVATSGTANLVVWQDRRNGNFDIYGALVGNDGSVSASFPICTAAGDQHRPAVAFDATTNQYMVVWSDARNANNPDIYAARVTTSGSVLDLNGTAISTASGGQFSPEIAAANGTFLVAWEDRRSDSAGDIYGARITGGSSLLNLDPTGRVLAAASGAQHAVAVAGIGTSFIVAWSDGRNQAVTRSDVYGLQIGVNGLSAGEFVISAGPESELNPSLAPSSAPGNVRVAYEKWRPDLQTIRVQSRLIGAGTGTGQPCSNNNQCSSGFCVDSKCCDSACGNNSQTDCQACAYSKTLQPDGVCAPIAAGTICRNYAHTFCDLREYCDGVDLACPADVGRNQGSGCTISGGGTGTCPANDATGSPHVCQ